MHAKEELMTVRVDYLIRVGPDDFVLPADVTDAQLPGVVADDLYGRLLFRTGDDDAFLEDDLLPLITGVCLQSMEYLAVGTPWVGLATRYPADFGLDTDGSTITVTIDGEPLLSAPAAAMMAALLDAGRRAPDDLAHILAHYPYGNDYGSALRALLAEAEQVLRGTGYDVPEHPL